MQIVILDNGSQPVPRVTLRGLTANFHYHYESGAFVRQIASLGSMLNTPFAMFCDDDNLLVPSGLRACLGVLADDADTLFAWGRTAEFQTCAGKTFLKESYIRDPGGFSQAKGSLDRVKGHMADYRPSAWYAMHRTRMFARLSAAAAFLLDSCSSSYAAEMAVEVAAFYNGPSRQVPQLTLLRSLENPPLDRHSVSRRLGFAEWLNSPSYSPEVGSFERLLTGLTGDTEGGAVMEILRDSFPGVDGAQGAGSGYDFRETFRRALAKLPAGEPFLEKASQAKGSFTWWRQTLAGGQAHCVAALCQPGSGRFLYSDRWTPDTVLDRAEIANLNW